MVAQGQGRGVQGTEGRVWPGCSCCRSCHRHAGWGKLPHARARAIDGGRFVPSQLSDRIGRSHVGQMKVFLQCTFVIKHAAAAAAGCAKAVLVSFLGALNPATLGVCFILLLIILL